EQAVLPRAGRVTGGRVVDAGEEAEQGGDPARPLEATGADVEERVRCEQPQAAVDVPRVLRRPEGLHGGDVVHLAPTFAQRKRAGPTAPPVRCPWVEPGLRLAAGTAAERGHRPRDAGEEEGEARHADRGTGHRRLEG